MRRLILVSALVLFLAVAYRFVDAPTTGRASPTLPGPSPNIGERAPSFSHERYGGGDFDLSDKGVYVLTFWDTLNRDSNNARPYFAQLAQDFEGSGVRFAAVYIGDPPGDVEPVPYDVVQDTDGDLAGMYNVKHVPRIFIISDGRVYLVHNNFLPENYDLLRENLEGLVSPGG